MYATGLDRKLGYTTVLFLDEVYVNEVKDKLMGEICFLVTGCISPSGNIYRLALKDEKLRYDQYIDSLKYYISKPWCKKLVFCDNSDSSVSDEIVKYAKKNKTSFEWISFCGNKEEAVRKGKGYGEGEIIDYALTHSQLLLESDYFIKITGRLKIKNLPTLFWLEGKNANIFNVDKEHVKAQTFFYMIEKECYNNNFREAFVNVDDRNNVFLENLFYEIIVKKGIPYVQLPIHLYVEGVSGSTGLRYSGSRLRVFLSNVKRIIKLKKKV